MSLKILKNYKGYNLDEVKELLTQTYWAKDRDKETIKKSIENSLVYFMYEDDKLVGYCRAITDYATNFYLCDVIVDSSCRGKGYGKKLVESILSDDEIKKIKGLLVTEDAHKLYEKYNFYSRENVFMQKNKE